MMNLMTIKAREEIKSEITTVLAPVCERLVVEVSPVGRVFIFSETSTRELTNQAFAVLNHFNIYWSESSWADDHVTAILWTTSIAYNVK